MGDSDRFTIRRFDAAVALCLVVALILRVWDLGAIPLELHPDEYAGYLGVREILTGHAPLRAFFEYGVTYLPLYGILQYICVACFGDTVTILRLPAALLGVVTAYATGLLAYQLVRRRAVLLFACGIMAILPWDIGVSRLGWEPAAMLPFVLFGLFFLLRGLEVRSARDIRVAFALLGVGAYSYRAEAFDASVLAAVVLALDFRRTLALWRPVLSGVLIGAILLLPIGLAFIEHTSYFSSGPAQLTFAFGVNHDTVENFISRYLGHFDVLPLFVTGDGNLQHGPASGVLYLWMLPFIVFGLLAPPRLVPLRTRLLLIAWLVVYPIGGALINEIPRQHFVRTLIGAPAFTILAAIGLVYAWQRFRLLPRFTPWRAPALTLACVIVALQGSAFGREYFVRYPDLSATVFHYGDRAIFAFVRAHQSGFDRVCFTVLDDWNYTAEIGYYMSNMAISPRARMESDCTGPRTLYAVPSPAQAPPATHLLGTVQYRDGSTRAYFFAPNVR